MSPTLYMSYSLPSTRAILMTAKLLNIDLNLKELEPHYGDTTTSEFLKYCNIYTGIHNNGALLEGIHMNPQHTLPTLDDDGFYLWESHAILPYLVGKYGKDEALYPKDLQKRAVIDQRMHFANSILGVRFWAMKIVKKQEPEAADMKKLEGAFGFLEAFLEKGEYLGGNALTIADFSNIIFVSLAILANLVDVQKYPKVAAWVSRLEALPCYSINRDGLEMSKQRYLYKK